MSQRRQENFDERVEPAPNQEHDDDYDTLLFWPSLSNRYIASRDSNSSPLYGAVSLSSESEGGHSWGSRFSLRPLSPLVFPPIVNWGSPPPVADDLDLGAAPSREPEAGGQMSPHLVRVIDGVEVKLHKPKSRAQ